MRRRNFLVGGLGVVCLTGCTSGQTLRIGGLGGAVPGRSLKEFEAQHKVNYKIFDRPDDLWKALTNLQSESGEVPAVISLGDSWLDRAIQEKLIQPFTPSLLQKIPNWQELGKKWQGVGQRQGIVWGIPYRWGGTAIVYRQDLVPEPISTWADLWRPELARKLILVDDPSEVIGLTLKKLGKKYHLSDPQSVPGLLPELQALHRQVLTYSSTDYIQPLLLEEAWTAVGWTTDLRRPLRQNPNLAVTIPLEGTALWTDMWVIPKGETENLSAVCDWVNASIGVEFASQLSALTDANSPRANLPLSPSVTADRLKFWNPYLLERSEFISDFSPEQKIWQDKIWAQLRSS